jgi:histidinol-phosphate aminotransferase
METFNLTSLLRPHLRNFKPYASARTEYTGSEGIFLDANENPYGSTNDIICNRYPDPFQIHVKQKLAGIKGVFKEQIFLGNGSDEAIDLLVRAFCEPGIDNILVCPPSYGMYDTAANLNNIEMKEVLLTEDFQLDIPNILFQINGNTKIIFVCSPNNPTGNLIHTEAIEQLLRSFNGIVVVDEAYIDFSSAPSWIEGLAEFPNLVVLQTFSKAWGMAGIRLGMAFASEEIIKIFNAIKPPYNISTLTQQQAMKGLTNVEKKNAMVEAINHQRDQLMTILAEKPYTIKIYPSDANFFLMKVSDPDALYQFLIENKVIVRNRNKAPLCKGCIRISVGTEDENDRLLELMDEFYL